MGSTSILQVILKVTKQGTGDKDAARSAKELKGALNELGLGSLATMGSLALLAAGVAAASKFMADGVEETIKYGKEVRGLKLLTGDTAEGTGRLIQVMDDYGIKTEALTMAQKTLSKEGLSLTIETLSDLSDEYKALQTPAEKTRFLIEKFGKTGLQFAEAMETGGDSLREMSAAVDESLVPTEAGLKAVREYEIAMDSWNEMIEATKLNIGNGLIPVLTDLMNWYMDGENAEKDMIATGKDWFLSTEAEKTAAIQAAAAQREHNTALITGAGATNELTEAGGKRVLTAQEQAAAEKELSEALKGQLGLMFDLQGENDKFNEKQEELKIKQHELAEQIKNEPWNQELQADLAATNLALEENAAKHEEASRRIVFSMLQTQLASDGLDKAEFEALTSIGVQWGLLDEHVAAQASSIQGSIQQYLDTGDLDAFNRSIEHTMNLPSTKSFTFSIQTVYSSTGIPAGMTGSSGAAMAQQWLNSNGYADGTDGWMQVPPGFPNDTYPIRLSSGEQFAVVPPGGGAPGSGGVPTVIVNYSPMISLADQNELNERMMPTIREGLRQLMNGR